MGMRCNFITFIVVFQLVFTAECSHPGENDACPEARTLTGPSGYLEAPLDPQTGKYPFDVFCTWEFDVPDHKFVTLRFSKLDVELSGSCENDRVEIYDGEDTYERFCGDQLPTPITLRGKDRVYINFVSDDYLSFSGFRIEYEVTDKPSCEGLVCKNRLCVPSSSKCDGIDQCGDGTDEENCTASAEADALPDPSCGMRPQDDENHRQHSRVTRVVGGKVATKGSWPWMVSFQKSYAFPSGHSCGGALINHRWIITAAHCVTAVVPAQQKLLLGSYRRYQEEEGQVARYPEKNCIHPGYKREVGMQNDIALIKLSVPVNYTSTISPICLPTEETQLPKSCIVTGWGRTQGTGYHDFLKQVEVPVLSKSDCGLEKEFCLLEEEGRNSPCYGDSGGPVVQKISGSWKLLGLISRGAEICGFRTDPTVCTHVASHLKWIKDQLMADSQGKPMQCHSTH